MMWLYTLFPKILHMSVMAGMVIVAVMLARLLLRRVPKIFCYVLWSVVLFRLLCPVAVPTSFSLFGIFETSALATEQTLTLPENPIGMDVGAAPEQVVIPDTVEMQESSATTVGRETGNAAAVALPVRVASVIWILGLAALLLYNGRSLLRLKRCLVGAVRIRENIYETDQVESPFVLGIVRPRIYLPTALEEKETDYIILHERTHIRRGDHIVKLVSFLALVLHWFNPLVWLAFFLSERDMEMSCDESVMKHMNGDIRAEYAALLLSLATGGRRIAGAPLAFGEGGTKERVKNVMRYKKPAAAVIVAALLAVLSLLAILGSNPKETEGTMFLLTNPAGGIEEVTATTEKTGLPVGEAQQAQSGEQQVFVKSWGKAFCGRDGEAIVSMSDKTLSEKMLSEETLLTETADGYSFGWSSPWPWDDGMDYSIAEVGDEDAVVLYYAWTSEPHVTVWREELTFRKDGDTYVMRTETLNYMDAICTGEEYVKAYPNGITGIRMDYRANGVGEVLNENAINHPDMYEKLFAPDTAAGYLLNLLDNPDKVELSAGEPGENGSVPVTICFALDGSMVKLNMIQPYGEDGIWIPQTYGVTTKVGKAVDGNGNSETWFVGW